MTAPAAQAAWKLDNLSMQSMPLLLPVALPILFWGAYHYHKDRYLPEPPGNLAACFALGLLAAAMSKALYVALGPLGLRYDAFELAASNTVGLFAFAMLAIGPIEELSKLLPFLIVVTRFRHFDEPMDGLIYASFIGLGYATAENLNYLAYLTPVEAAARGFAGPVVHILFASIWAYWISSALLAKKSIWRPAIIGFGLAAALHGVYDFLVLLRPIAALPMAAMLIIAIWIWRLRVLRQLHRDAVARDEAAS
ncbi:MAG: PrsW family intramembrane metalloprotease [Gammaproteobacteria bacterium]|nr:PrsW family intramembrane metalloprotease [Gammaproteobacteria bacterium]